MIGRLLCQIGLHHDWLIRVTGTPANLVLVMRCTRCKRVR